MARPARVAARSRPQTRAHLGRPPRGLEAVRLEERQRHPLEAEAEARGARRLAVARADLEDAAEVILVPVERADRRRRRRRDDGHENFELELLVALAGRHDLAAATEERIRSDIARDRQADRAQERQATLE